MIATGRWGRLARRTPPHAFRSRGRRRDPGPGQRRGAAPRPTRHRRPSRIRGAGDGRARELLDEADLYDDVRPALAALRGLGFRVVVAGNQTARAGQLLRDLDLPVDLVATSAEWDVAKPQRAFFERALEAARAEPQATVYVGDHPANDVFPAKAAGLRVAHLRRGPWGHLWADDPQVVAAADWQVDSLTELVALAADWR